MDAALAQTGDVEDPLAAAVRATRMPIVVTNPRLADNPLVFVNDAFCKLTGYARSELLGRNCRLLQGPKTNQGEVTKLRGSVLAQQPVDIEILNYCKDGTPFWNRLHIVPLHDVSGTLIYFFASQLDVTAERDRLASLERQNAALLEEMAARQRADLSNAAKSRFLAVASHDIRQPLQSLLLLQGTLAKMVHGQAAGTLIGRLGHMLDSMSSMLTSLLDLNQIEAGAVRIEVGAVRIEDILDRIIDGFAFDAHAKGLVLRVVACSLYVHSDARLLEQMVRNLVANAVKYTDVGKILLGCRRHDGMLRLEVWDTGIGIPQLEVEAIFQEYHQLEYGSHRSNHGLGLGLAIVQRLAGLLHHTIQVSSRPGSGSMFSIELPLAGGDAIIPKHQAVGVIEDGLARLARRTIAILLIEDDPETSASLSALLEDEGYSVVVSRDCVLALAMVERDDLRPDLIMTDSRLPADRNGPAFTMRLQQLLGYDIPVIMLTGEVSTELFAGVELPNHLRLTKPVKLRELTQAVQRALSVARSVTAVASRAEAATEPGLTGCLVLVVDDNEHIGDAIRTVIEADGGLVETYATSEAFMAAYRPGPRACLLVDAYLPGMNGIDLLRQLRHDGDTLPAIMITGNSDVAMAVAAMKAGASDFIEKPVGAAELLASIRRAIDSSAGLERLAAWRETASSHLGGLTERQRQIMVMVLAGQPSKNIAADLGISQRTVENHRASVMRKTGAKSLPALARLALAANWGGADGEIVMPALG